MSKLRIGVSVDDGDLVDELESAIKDGIKEGLQSTGEEMESVSSNRIKSVGAIFSGDLLSSFSTELSKTERGFQVKLINDSDHAAPIEYGATYTKDKGPPINALIPWVAAKMNAFTIPEGESIPDPEEMDVDRNLTLDTGETIDVFALAPPGVIKKAYWLNKRIKEEGIDPVRYMEMAEEYASKSASSNIADTIDAELSSRI